MANKQQKTLGILVGGGPAPGINGVISSATIEARNQGLRVLGFFEGFRWLMREEPLEKDVHYRELDIRDVSRIHVTGGSLLRTSRANPTKDRALLKNVVRNLQRLGVDYLLTIGGDDTAFSASKVYEASGGKIAVVHVPKTIDNDLPLPDNMPTFGFESARHLGTLLVQNLMEDARTTQRWYIVVAMGREAGHLALGIGKAAGATLTLIPEEFPERMGLDFVVDTILGSYAKRRAEGRHYGVVVVAEGIAEKLDPATIETCGDLQRDEHGHLILSEIPLGRILKEAVERELAVQGIRSRWVEQEIGYVLRSARPIAFDIEYTRNLGYGAVKFLLSGRTGAMVAFRRGVLHPLFFDDIMDPRTGRTRVRLVDVDSDIYEVASHYMIRLRKDDFEDPQLVEAMARALNMEPQAFVQRFRRVAVSVHGR